ncbi:MAG: homoserine O-succinyltransferase [Prevotellaceae bacterium]|nr:homoserine O-succinyltransferase [Prevotella sp.]MDD7248199.1 homoserine O-succinyltransferase [Prevotellaceae bacterium]MDY2750327.1 homoserine O-succinyltransferase [Prevotella sp.]
MPLRLPDKLPAIKLLEDENIFVIDETRGHSQDIRPLRLAILNLMPIKVTTETDLVRLLSNTPLQIDVTFMKLKSHTSKNTPIEHMKQFYIPFDELRNRKFDGMIVTGAPVEGMAFEEVNYWQEISEIFTWARANVTSTLYICWAAQAALYHFYGIDKHQLPKKTFGVFTQNINPAFENIQLFRGFDSVFAMPHSRHTENRKEDVEKVPDVSILAESAESGPSILMARGGREIFVTGHMEYNPDTLDTEYRRDLGKRDDVDVPVNYYIDDDPEKGPLVTWRAHANLFYHNWINYYIYQRTPYDISQISHDMEY